MANFWLYREGGTRAFATGIFSAAGATPSQAEWDDLSNCFDSNASSNVEPWRIIATAVGDGETVMFYDEADGVSVTTHSIENGTTSTASTAGTINITSRSGNPALCLISPKTNTTAMMIHNQAVTVVDYNYTGIGFVGNGADFTKDIHPAFIQFQNACGDVVFDNCTFGDINLAPTSDNQWGMMHCVDARTVTLNDCEFKNITSEVDSLNSVWAAHMKAGSTLNITGALSVHDVTMTVSGQIRAGFKCDGTTNITGDVTVKDINCSTTGDTDIIGAVFTTTKDAAIMNCTGSITANNLTSIGGNASAVLFAIQAVHNINNITAKNITVTKGTHALANGRGGLMLLQTETAIGTVRNIVADNINVWAGAVVYYSNGAGGNELSPGVAQSLCESVKATNCSAIENGGGLYKGGDGSVKFRGIFLDNCNCVGVGGGFYGMHADRGDAEDTSIILENATIINCKVSEPTTLGAGHGVYITSGSGTIQNTTSILKNVIVRCEGDGDIVLAESVADQHTSSIINCDIENYAATGIKDNLNTAWTDTNNGDDSAQININGTLTKDATYKTTGVSIAYGSKDANGRLLGLPTPIGGFGKASCSADTRKTRV